MQRFSTAAVTLTLILLGACGTADAAQQVREFDGQRAVKRVSEQLAFGPRVPGSKGHAQMAAWLDSLTRTLADTVIVQRWWHHTVAGDSIPMVNLIARFKPEAKDRILYLAHWDTRPRADAAGSQKPIPGANDGASGVAVLIGVAEALKKTPPKGGVDLLFVDGEDYGFFLPEPEDVLIGSTYYVAHPVAPEKPRFVVLFDMVGQYDLKLPIEQESQVAASDVVELIWGTGAAMGYGHIFVRESGGAVIDDHIPFIRGGYKAVDLIPDIGKYPAWHTLDDALDKISWKSLEAVGNVAVAVIRKTFK